MSSVRRVVNSFFSLAACLVLLLCSSTTHAITVSLSLTELTGLADTVVLGTVVSSSSLWNAEHNNIYKSVIVSVTDSLKGSAGKKTITLIMLGGTVGEITQWVEDTATFETGEHVGLFLKDLNNTEVSQMGLDSAARQSEAGSAAQVIGGLQGKLSIAKDNLSTGGGISADKFKRNVQMAITGQIVPEEENPRSLEGEISNIYDISAISPTSASAGTNSLVTVIGSGFGPTRGSSDNLMFFYTLSGSTAYYMPATTYVSWSDTQIEAYVPVCSTCGPSTGYPYSAASGPVRVLKGTTWGSRMDFTVSFGYGMKRWSGDSPNISYKVPDGIVSGRSTAIQSAMASWTDAGSKLRFIYGGTHTQTVKSLNGVNEILWISLPAGVLGQATMWSSNGVITECDFAFATAYTWSYADTCPSGQYDIQSIATHEIGHFLSLRDLYGNHTGYFQDTDKIMYGRASSGTTKRTLHAHDILGIQWIYGIQPTTPPACPAAIDANYLLHIPYISYVDPASGSLSLWADFVYEFNPTYPSLLPFKLANYGTVNDAAFSCAASMLSSDLKLRIPDVLLPDGSTRLWADLAYGPTLSADGNVYFLVTNYGILAAP